MATTLCDILPATTRLHEHDIEIGGCSLTDLAETYGTPLYVYDRETLEQQAQRARDAFSPLWARVSYAAKACAIIGVLRVFRNAGLHLDVVSEGELQAGLNAGFVPDQIHLHGNNKSDAELRQAVALGLHAVVADSLEELQALDTIADQAGRPVRVMLRLTLPIEAVTHPHLQTSGYHSKFGFYRDSEALQQALQVLAGSRFLHFTGLHVHLGSQIHEISIYRAAAEDLAEIAGALAERGLKSTEISLGGGWAVPYRPGDPMLQPEEVAAAIEPLLHVPEASPAVEPGRALVARAAVAVYRVGAVKESAEAHIVAVDGGMGDNPRPALYDARYIALAVRNPAEMGTPAMVAGRYCESGDILVQDGRLPPLRRGDLVCVPTAGAYQLAMASRYNLVPPPAAVLAQGGQATLLMRRGTIQDVLAQDMGAS